MDKAKLLRFVRCFRPIYMGLISNTLVSIDRLDRTVYEKFTLIVTVTIDDRFWGSEVSITSMSFETRDSIRPVGVLSKNNTDKRIMLWRRPRWISAAALMPPMLGSKEQKTVDKTAEGRMHLDEDSSMTFISWILARTSPLKNFALFASCCHVNEVLSLNFLIYVVFISSASVYKIKYETFKHFLTAVDWSFWKRKMLLTWISLIYVRSMDTTHSSDGKKENIASSANA